MEEVEFVLAVTFDFGVELVSCSRVAAWRSASSVAQSMLDIIV